LKKQQLTLYDKGSLTADHLYNLAKKLHKQGKLDILIIDYLQLMDGGKRSNGSDVQDISYITRKLKQLAQEIYIHSHSYQEQVLKQVGSLENHN